MTKKFLILIAFFIVSKGFLFAQTDDAAKITKLEENYDRSGLTYLLLNFNNDRYADYLRNASAKIVVPSKFDNNILSETYISGSYYRDEHSQGVSNLSDTKSKIQEKLIESRLNYKLLEFWWGIHADGSYTANTIQERGIYNATDFDVSKADGSKIGRAQLGDAGEQLIGNSYIFVYDIKGIKTMTEIYDAQDAAAKAKAEKDKTEFKPVNRTKNGFKGEIVAYLYRLAYNDTIQAYFFESFSDESTIDIDKFNTIYNNVSQPIKYVSYTTASAEGTQMNANPIQKTTQELFDKLVNDGISSAISSFEQSLEQFRVKTPIVNASPIKAKVGIKEGITTDRRFFVWEYIEKSNGETDAKRAGIVRSRYVHDNRNDELGNMGTTNFYQVSGGRIREGMILQERVDLGVSFAMGLMSYAEKTAFLMRMELSLSQYLGYVINTPLTAFKFFGDVSFQSDKDREVNGVTDDFSYTHFTLGLNKEFYFARRFHFGFLAGGGVETASWKDTDDSEDIDNSGHYSTIFAAVGGKFGVNIGKTKELVVTVMQNSPMGDVTKYDSEGELDPLFPAGVKWTDTNFFPERSGLGVDFTLRILF